MAEDSICISVIMSREDHALLVCAAKLEDRSLSKWAGRVLHAAAQRFLDEMAQRNPAQLALKRDAEKYEEPIAVDEIDRLFPDLADLATPVKRAVARRRLSTRHPPGGAASGSSRTPLSKASKGRE